MAARSWVSATFCYSRVGLYYRDAFDRDESRLEATLRIKLGNLTLTDMDLTTAPRNASQKRGLGLT